MRELCRLDPATLAAPPIDGSTPLRGQIRPKWRAAFGRGNLSDMSDVTVILSAIHQGDPAAADQLLAVVYDELRRLAAQKLAHEKPGQTLDPTALVHEAYLRLFGNGAAPHWEGRRHFFGSAAEAMRRILIESARRKKRLRHGGDRQQVELPVRELALDQGPPEDLLALARPGGPRRGTSGETPLLYRPVDRTGRRDPRLFPRDCVRELELRAGLAALRASGQPDFKRKLKSPVDFARQTRTAVACLRRGRRELRMIHVSPTSEGRGRDDRSEQREIPFSGCH
jgi:RNA polymerase sigma factor (TIGR02999 family)